MGRGDFATPSQLTSGSHPRPPVSSMNWALRCTSLRGVAEKGGGIRELRAWRGVAGTVWGCAGGGRRARNCGRADGAGRRERGNGWRKKKLAREKSLLIVDIIEYVLQRFNVAGAFPGSGVPLPTKLPAAQSGPGAQDHGRTPRGANQAPPPEYISHDIPPVPAVAARAPSGRRTAVPPRVPRTQRPRRRASAPTSPPVCRPPSSRFPSCWQRRAS